MDQQKLERIVTGIEKSQAQEARRAANRERAAHNERDDEHYVVVPRMPVIDRREP